MTAAPKARNDAHTNTLAMTFIQVRVFRTIVRSKQSVLKHVEQTASKGPGGVIPSRGFSDEAELDRWRRRLRRWPLRRETIVEAFPAPVVSPAINEVGCFLRVGADGEEVDTIKGSVIVTELELLLLFPCNVGGAVGKAA